MPRLSEETAKRARERLRGYCRVCSFCNGVACRGEVPGMGGTGSGSGFIRNVSTLAEWRLIMRTIHKVHAPATGITLFGIPASSPILAAPMAGMNYNLGGKISEEDIVRAVIRGGKQAGSPVMTGDGMDPEEFLTGVSVIHDEGWGIPVLKPWRVDRIKERIRICESHGASAVGIDLDGIGLDHPGTPREETFLAKTREDLEEIIMSTHLPVILKGIMSEEDAELAAASGAAGIVVSNHGGRVLDGTQGVAEVLPAIAKRVSECMTVLADGGVRTGEDVLKYLALGANAVLVGRPLLIAAAGGGAEAVGKTLVEMAKELRLAMVLTGCQSLNEIGSHILVRKS